jgi:plasmid stability protein
MCSTFTPTRTPVEHIMTNLTLSIDEQLIKKARIKAIEEGTSLSAKIRELLTQYVQSADQKQLAGQAILAAAARSQANSAGATWSKDELHDRSPQPSGTRAA